MTLIEIIVVITILSLLMAAVGIAVIPQLDQAKVYPSPIVTQVVELKAFYPGEDYHQNYCNRNPRNPYVQSVAMPKVEKVKKEEPELLKKK